MRNTWAGRVPAGYPAGTRQARVDLSGLGRPRVAQRARGGEALARLEQRLEAGEDHRPAAVQLRVGALRELVVDDRQPTGSVADRLYLPGHPRGPRGLHV